MDLIFINCVRFCCSKYKECMKDVKEKGEKNSEKLLNYTFNKLNIISLTTHSGIHKSISSITCLEKFTFIC